jgi:predicted helicase
LAYYIAAVNIENAYHDLLPDATSYQSFEGICLTDTFQLGESNDAEKLFSDMFPQNSKRVQRQQKAPLRIIFGNPPYSIGQKSANDNAQNQSYPKLDQRIADTYAKQSSAGLSKSLYDSYIKAFRWSTERLDKTGGIIAFITNSGWLDGNGMDGFRKSIEKEFTSIYVFNLRGNIRGFSGIAAKKEGQNVFDIMTGVAITLLVKNPNLKTEKATIHYHDIGDFLNKKEKISKLIELKSFGNKQMPLKTIEPNVEGDWVSMRNKAFDNFIPLAPIKKFDSKTETFFVTNIIGVSSNRDAWVYNYSKQVIADNMQKMINFYNEQKTAFKNAIINNSSLKIESFINSDPKRISWTRALRNDATKGLEHSFKTNEFKTTAYRPFNKQIFYSHKAFIESPGLSNKLFPNNTLHNIVICVSGIGAQKEFSPFAVYNIPTLDIIHHGQCFPLYYYEENNATQKGLFDAGDNSQDYIRRDAISDFILERANNQYGTSTSLSGRISKEDIFYYVYGFLHSKEYRETFANDLKKMLPRLPLVEEVKDFWAFSKAGRKLAELHLNYETVAPFADAKVSGDDGKFYTVEKLRFPKKDQKETIIYNSKITISNIPAQAYEYIVNGKSAIEWIMERYQVTTHKESGIVNNPNDWVNETGNPRYILDLLLSIINVSVQTVDIVNSLPNVKFE